MIAPVFESLAHKYPSVTFVKIDVDQAQEIAQEQRVRAMPTFKFFFKGGLLEEMQGADAARLEALIIKHMAAVTPAPTFGGKGYSLASSSANSVPLDPTAARLAKFGGGISGATGHAAPPAAPISAAAVLASADDDDEELARAIALSVQSQAQTQATTATSNTTAKPKIVSTAVPVEAADADRMDVEDADELAQQKKEREEDPDQMVPLPVDANLLAELIEMGFSDIRARKGLHFGGSSVDGAVSWLADHEADANIDQEFLVRKSDVNKVPLTPEQIEQKMQQLKQLALARRQQREKDEAKEAIQREKERRERGQKMEQTAEERAKLQRQRELEKVKKEKADAKAEKERIMAELARDKEIRARNNGVLPSVLGVGGYNPAAIQYEQDATKGSGATVAASAKSSTAAASSAQTSTGSVTDTVEQAIMTISRYRTRGDGGNALKLLALFVKNVATNPSEVKYRSINTESAAYKTKLAGLVGPANLLRALGFEKNSEGKLVLGVSDTDTSSFLPLFQTTLQKLEMAIEKFTIDNP